MSGVTETKKRLALSVIDFLRTSLRDGTLNATDDAESIDIATSCISDVFHVDPSETAEMIAATSPPLHEVYSTYHTKIGSTTTASSSKEQSQSTPTASGAAPVTNPEADKLKSAGNAAMAKKDYATAIDKYTQAVSMAPANPIYLSNRAAAYSASGRHAEAAADAEIAVAADPKYTKAWSRLGLAKFALGDARGAMEAYQKGIEYEDGVGSEAMRKGLETAKKRVEEMEKEEATLPEDAPDEASSTGRGMPDLSSLAGMFGGGGGGGGGGMPDLGSLMSNPMFAGMARNLMQNPEALSGLMNNPRVQQMMEGLQGGRGGGGAGGGGGGGMPDLGSLMSDPNIAALASQFMGGGGGGAGAGGAGRGAGQGR